MTYTGGCLCGQLRYTIEAEPVGARMCWCRDCQRIASGSATSNAMFPVSAVTFSGEAAIHAHSAESGNTVERGFCPTCGSHVFARTSENPDTPIRIRVGTLDAPHTVAPQAIIWTSSAPSWAVLDPALPHFPKAPAAAPAK